MFQDETISKPEVYSAKTDLDLSDDDDDDR